MDREQLLQEILRLREIESRLVGMEGAYHGHQGFLTFSKRTSVFRQSRLNGMKLFDPPYSNLIRKIVDFMSK